jgi:hypothetical protein
LRPLQNAPFCLRQRTLADQAQILILKILNVFLWLIRQSSVADHLSWP